MSATYTFDVFATLDGYGSYGPDGDWGGYWGKQGPELLDHRLSRYNHPQHIVFGAKTFRMMAKMVGLSKGTAGVDEWNLRMRDMPATVVSTTLKGPLDWPNATVVSGDAVDIVARLKKESPVPLRSHGSLSLNRALMAAGLVDFSAERPGPLRSSRVRTISTWNYSSTGHWTAAPKNRSTVPPSIEAPSTYGMGSPERPMSLVAARKDTSQSPRTAAER